jgi:hypothetical protein
MPAPTIYARIQPKSIKVTEKYNYQAEPLKRTAASPKKIVARSDGEQPNGDKPTEKKVTEGKIEVVVPYDGEKYFTREHLDAISRQRRRIWKDPKRQVAIGNLAFENYQAANLSEGLRLGSEHDTIAFKLPLGGDNLPADPELLLQDLHAAKFVHEYSPKFPSAPPVHMTLRLRDEADLDCVHQQVDQWFPNDHELLDHNECDLDPAVFDFLRRHEGFERSLFIDLQFKLILPATMLAGAGEAVPKVERVSLDWPLALAPPRMSLIQNMAEQSEARCDVRYEPEQGQITWGEVALHAQPSTDPEDKALTYQSPLLRLAITQPGELVALEIISGNAQFKFPGVLSGTKVQFFDATGHPMEFSVGYETTVVLDFQMETEDGYQAQCHTPYHYLHFEGVLLNEDRVADVHTILAKLGFAVASGKVQGSSRMSPRWFVAGCRKLGADDLWIWILLEGRKNYTQRRRDIPGSLSYATNQEIGDLCVRIRGRMQGDYHVLVEQLGEVQASLTRIFPNVAVPA